MGPHLIPRVEILINFYWGICFGIVSSAGSFSRLFPLCHSRQFLGSWQHFLATTGILEWPGCDKFSDKIFVTTVIGLEPATSCVRDQDATTVPVEHT